MIILRFFEVGWVFQKAPVCGDGILDEGEMCDYLANDSVNNPYGGLCRSSCKIDISGSSNGWLGCKGNGASICVEKVNDSYFQEHLSCTKNFNCKGSYFKCNNNLCPPPEDYSMKKNNLSSCNDTDGGLSYYIKGSATGSMGTGVGTAYDECDLADQDELSGELREAYCLPDGTPSIYYYSCPYGCNEGVCIQG